MKIMSSASLIKRLKWFCIGCLSVVVVTIPLTIILLLLPIIAFLIPEFFEKRKDKK